MAAFSALFWFADLVVCGTNIKRVVHLCFKAPAVSHMYSLVPCRNLGIHTPCFADSPPAVLYSASGLVFFGLKAASSTAAAWSSEPDLLISFGSGFKSSLPWASLLAHNLLDVWNRRAARNWRRGKAKDRRVREYMSNGIRSFSWRIQLKLRTMQCTRQSESSGWWSARERKLMPQTKEVAM